jgi:hypothetical protein
MIETYLMMMLSILIGFSSFGNNPLEIAGQLSSYVFFVCYISVIPWTISKVSKDITYLKSSLFRTKYGALTEDLHLHTPNSVYQTVIFFIRRTLYCVALYLFFDEPMLCY